MLKQKDIFSKSGPDSLRKEKWDKLKKVLCHGFRKGDQLKYKGKILKPGEENDILFKDPKAKFDVVDNIKEAKGKDKDKNKKKALSDAKLLEKLFISPEDQINIVKGWIRDFRLPFAEPEIESISRTIPPWPLKEFVVNVLVIYLSTLEKTMELYWDLIFPDRVIERWESENIGFGKSSLRLITGETGFEKRLEWRTIDLVANQKTRPGDVRDSSKSVGVELLACAALHKGWLRCINGIDLEGVYLTGLEAKDSGLLGFGGSWSEVPVLEWDRHQKKACMSFVPSDSWTSYRCSPVFDEEQEPEGGEQEEQQWNSNMT